MTLPFSAIKKWSTDLLGRAGSSV